MVKDFISQRLTGYPTQDRSVPLNVYTSLAQRDSLPTSLQLDHLDSSLPVVLSPRQTLPRTKMGLHAGPYQLVGVGLGRVYGDSIDDSGSHNQIVASED